MTKKKVEKEEKESAEPNLIEEKEGVEPELLEEKEETEQKLLEYYSKEDLLKKLKELETAIKNKDDLIKELDGWKNKFTLLQAEFENAQKRWDKTRQDLRIQYNASVLKDFLPLYDSFKKAIEDDTGNETLKQFYNQFLNILKFQGAELINVNINDSFDYSIHDALSSIERNDIAENKIVDIVQDGWKLSKDVIRYAKVIISKKPKPPEPEPEPKPKSEPTAEETNIEKEKKDTDQSKIEKDNT